MTRSNVILKLLGHGSRENGYALGLVKMASSKVVLNWLVQRSC